MGVWPFGKKSTPEQTQEGEGRQTAEEQASQPKNVFSKLKQGLKKTTSGLKQLFSLHRTIDEEFLDDLEVKLFEADFGPDLVAELLSELKAAWKEKEIRESDEIPGFLQQKLLARLTAREQTLARAENGPTVFLVAGVNGTGKTTSIAKLSYWLREQGHSVLLAAADTFRAGATEQLSIWSERVNIPIVLGSAKKKDPAAVAYTACERAVEEKIDYLIVDTAGRLHTQTNLMRELEKVRRVIANKIGNAPHETLLVLDATCGQNALNQAESFHQAISLTGLIMAKLDGTAKGGIVITVNNRFQIPVKFVGLGEQVTDLAPFDPDKFVKALFG